MGGSRGKFNTVEKTFIGSLFIGAARISGLFGLILRQSASPGKVCVLWKHSDEEDKGQRLMQEGFSIAEVPVESSSLIRNLQI